MTIADNDTPVVSVAATDPTASEVGPDTGTFTFTRLGSKSGSLKVNFSVGGTATSGVDYTALGTSVTFPAGSATVTKTVTPLKDTLVEPDETVTVTLAAGTGYTVGAPAAATVTILADDAVAPQIAAAQPANGAWVRTTTPVISATFSDAAPSSGINLASVVVKVDGSVVAAQANANGFSYAPAGLGQGAHAVNVSVADNAGNVGSAAWSFTVDTIAPVITVPADQVAEATGPTGATVAYPPATATDAQTANPTITYSAASGSLFPLGQTVVTVTATDAAGNQSTATFNVTVRDTAAPAIAGFQPADGAWVKVKQPAISATFADSASGVNAGSTVVKVDGGEVVADKTVAGFTYIPAADLPEGSHTVQASVADQSGNVGSAQWSFSVDTVGPSVANQAPADGASTTALRPAISASFADVTSGVDAASVHVFLGADEITANANVTAAGFSYTPATDLAPGAQTVRVELTDVAGNAQNTQWSFTISVNPPDTDPPVVYNLQPWDGALIVSAQPTITGLFQDDGSGVNPASVVILFDTQDVTLAGDRDGGRFRLHAAGRIGGRCAYAQYHRRGQCRQCHHAARRLPDRHAQHRVLAGERGPGGRCRANSIRLGCRLRAGRRDPGRCRQCIGRDLQRRRGPDRRDILGLFDKAGAAQSFTPEFRLMDAAGHVGLTRLAAFQLRGQPARRRPDGRSSLASEDPRAWRSPAV